METIENTTLAEVEKLFTDQLYTRPGMTASISQYSNICCDENDETDIIRMGERIKRIPEFASLSFREVYIVLVYIYYSLRLNEQIKDWLPLNFLQEKLLNNQLALKLFIDITTGDIMINGENFSSYVRRYILGMRMRGGKKRNRSKRNKRKRNKSKRNKTKKYTAKKI